MTARMVRLYVFLAAIACACGAGVQRWLMRADPSLPGPWFAQFAILLAVTSCFSALLFLFGSSPRVVTTLLFLRFIPLAVIGIPEGAHVGIILSLGVGYVIVSRDITKNHGVVLIGAMEKIIFFIDGVATFAVGEVAASVVAFGTIDLVFGILFIEFLLWTKKQPKA